jgi:GTP cyclohydrolase I
MISTRPPKKSQDLGLLRWFQEILPDSPQAIDDLARTLDDNPGRISRAYRSLLSGYGMDPARVIKFAAEVRDNPYAGLVSSLDIPFLSICAHHFLPFFGTIDIIYQPATHLVGIGKLSRLVSCRSKRFQLQELLTKSICEDLMLHARAQGAYVRSSARHTCVCYRGPEMQSVVNQSTSRMGSLAQADQFHEVLALLSARR